MDSAAWQVVGALVSGAGQWSGHGMVARRWRLLPNAVDATGRCSRGCACTRGIARAGRGRVQSQVGLDARGAILGRTPPAYLNPKPAHLSQSCVIRILANEHHQSTGELPTCRPHGGATTIPRNVAHFPWQCAQTLTRNGSQAPSFTRCRLPHPRAHRRDVTTTACRDPRSASNRNHSLRDAHLRGTRDPASITSCCLSNATTRLLRRSYEAH